MSFNTILIIALGFLALIGLTLFFFFIQWLDKKIDKKERLGKKESWRKPQSKDQIE
jgi:hypothetical protein